MASNARPVTVVTQGAGGGDGLLCLVWSKRSLAAAIIVPDPDVLARLCEAKTETGRRPIAFCSDSRTGDRIAELMWALPGAGAKGYSL